MLFGQEPAFVNYSIVTETVNGSLFVENLVKHVKWYKILEMLLLCILTVWTIIWIILSPNRRRHYITEHRLLYSIAILLQWLPVVLMLFYVPSPKFVILNVIVVIVVTIIKASRVLVFIPLLSCWRSSCVLGRAVVRSWYELFSVLLIMGLFIAAGGYLVFVFEMIQSNFQSIDEGLWWAVITVTTVGYGDLYPLTRLGELVGIMLAISGFILMALPVPVLYRNYHEEWNKEMMTMRKTNTTSHNTGRVTTVPTATVV